MGQMRFILWTGMLPPHDIGVGEAVALHHLGLIMTCADNFPCQGHHDFMR